MTPLVLTLLLAAPPDALRAPVVTDAVALASGDRHVCVVARGGAVACWGDGRFRHAGMVKGRPTEPRDGVVVVAGIDDAVALAAGFTTTCFIRRSREVVCAGGGFSGMTGEPGAPFHPVPLSAYPASRWARSIAVGGQRAAIASAAGEVDFFATPIAAPIPARGFDARAVEVAVGWLNVCARDEGGGVRCFGPNYGGENGNGGDGESREAVVVLAAREPTAEVLDNAYAFCRFGDDCETPLTGAVDLDMHGRTTCVALASGRVACWGGDREAPEMNLGKLGFARVPLYMPGIDDAVEVAVGGGFACARGKAGDVRCWGANEAGQLGAAGPARGAPEPVPGLGPAIAISAGDAHACALAASGAVRCWGEVVPARAE